MANEIKNYKNYTLLDKIGSVYIYENKDAYPRAYMVFDFKVISESEEESAMKNLQDFTPDFKSLVYLTERPDLAASGELVSGSVQLLKQSSGFYKWQVSTPKPGILFISESFNSGWQASVDGIPSKVYKANFAFQGIAVPGGNHVVKLSYNPESFRFGKILSLGSLGGILFALIVWICWLAKEKFKLKIF